MQHIKIDIPEGILNGDLVIPKAAEALILFAHGSGSSRHSPRNQQVAQTLQQYGLATLLFDLLTPEEEINEIGSEYRFNVDLLTDRLILATQWIRKSHPQLKIGYFGASTGAAAALKASLKVDTFAIVSRGGRPDLAMQALPWIQAPTLLIVGGDDEVVLSMNREAMEQMQCIKELAIVEGATHLFEEPGKLKEVAELAAKWFLMMLHKKAAVLR